jgi:hypothetical protein
MCLNIIERERELESRVAVVKVRSHEILGGTK